MFGRRERAQQFGGYYRDLVYSCDESILTEPETPTACSGIRLPVAQVHDQPIGELLKLDAKAGPGPARRFAPNAWGLYDILGRLEEVVADFMQPYPAGGADSVDPRDPHGVHDYLVTGEYGPAPTGVMVVRGGHFFDRPEALRFAARREAPHWYNYIEPTGVRLVLYKLEDGEQPLTKRRTIWDALEEYQDSLPDNGSGPAASP